MQESGVEAQDAERHGADWYLSRNGEQIGPLTDRELSLFAEGGNFKPGDLLWTAGLDGWKPPDAIFGLSGDSENTEEEAAPGEDAVFTVDTEDEPGDVPAGDLSEIEGEFRADADKDAAAGHEAVDFGAAHLDAEHLDGHDQHLDHLDGNHPAGEHVYALAQRLKGESLPLTAKERGLAALKAFGGPAGYLFVVFVVLAAYAWLGDARVGPGLGFFILTTINAFVVFQLMGFADRFSFVQDLEQKPLIYSILYKTLTFGTLVFAVYGLELTVFGLLGVGGSSAGGGLAGTLTLWFILSVAMFPYFAFKALERAVGADMIGKLLFGRS